MAFTRSVLIRLLRTDVLVKNCRRLQQNSLSTNVSFGGDDEVLVGKVFRVTTIGINRPSKRNCVNAEVAEKIRSAIEDFENDSSSPVAVLYGTGGNFCSGYDLKSLADMEDMDSLRSEIAAGSVGLTKRIVKKPLIAAISGYAVASGFELALLCDLRVVEETAVMGVLCRRFGVPIVDGGTVRLQAMVGLSRALDLILTGRTIYAKEAFEWGIANRIVACGTGFGQALQLAESLVKFPQECLLADRDSTYNSAFNARSFNESMEYEKSKVTDAVVREAYEGAKKFKSGVGRHGKTNNLTELPQK